MPDANLERRDWVYVMRPAAYEIAGCECGNADPDWSEYKGHLWCAACQKDFVPASNGVFDGPILVNVSHLLGLSFDVVVFHDSFIRMQAELAEAKRDTDRLDLVLSVPEIRALISERFASYLVASAEEVAKRNQRVLFRCWLDAAIARSKREAKPDV